MDDREEEDGDDGDDDDGWLQSVGRYIKLIAMNILLLLRYLLMLF